MSPASERGPPGTPCCASLMRDPACVPGRMVMRRLPSSSCTLHTAAQQLSAASSAWQLPLSSEHAGAAAATCRLQPRPAP